MKFRSFILIALWIPFLTNCNFGSDKGKTGETIEVKEEPIEVSQWRGPDRNGIYPEDNLLSQWPDSTLNLIWDFHGLGLGYSSASVTNNRVYIAGTIDSSSFLYAFDHDGEMIWKTPLGPEWMKTFPGMRATPLIYGDKGYIINGLGKLFCFDIQNGNIIWSKEMLKDFNAKNLQHGINENLLVDGGKIYCTPGGIDSNIVALNRLTGELVWVSEGSGEKSAYCSPLLFEHNDTKYFVTMTFKTLVAVKAETGEVAWKRTLEGDIYGVHPSTPYYMDGYLFAQDGYEVGCFMLKINEDGMGYEEVWQNRILDETNGHCVVFGNNIYGAGETKKRFVCLDWNTGEVKYYTKEIANGTVIAADNLLYCCTYDGHLSLVQPSDTAFNIISTIKLPGKGKEHITHPVIKNGRLYVRHINSLWVYNIAKS